MAVAAELHQRLRKVVAGIPGATMQDFTARALEAALALTRKNGKAKS